jgi:hypothetical protein
MSDAPSPRTGADVAKAAADPAAALIALLVAMAGYTGLVARLGLTADDVAMICGYLLAGAAALRSYFARKGGDAAT